jgi:MFS family permease
MSSLMTHGDISDIGDSVVFLRVNKEERMTLADNDPMFLYALLILGIGMLLYATAGTYVGKTRDRLGRAVYRAEDPRYFWGLILLYYSLGICSIGFFLYKRLTCT